MSLPVALLLFVVGIVLLVKGADWLIEHAALLAEGLGVPHMVVGLTIVAFGTSAPELAAGVGSAYRGVGGLALGTVIGSNIANMALILGAAALIAPLSSPRVIKFKEIPIMLVVLLIGVGTMLGNRITRLEGAGLFGLVILYTLYAYKASKHEPEVFEHDVPTPEQEQKDAALAQTMPAFWWAKHVFFLVIGAVCLTGGAELLVRSATDLAHRIGIPEIVIGLTMVAIGTSLPELATSIRAACKGHSELLLGNVIGSNVFNTLCVLGATAMTKPIKVTKAALTIDGPMMLVICLLIWILICLRKTIGRLEGSILLAIYLGYIVFTFFYAGSRV